MHTWGISGPAFLMVYGGLLGVVVAAIASDRFLDRGRGRSRVKASELDDYEVAMLNGDAAVVAAVALLALDRNGVIELGDRMVAELSSSQDLDLANVTEWALAARGIGMEVVLVQPLPAGAHPVEVAVHEAVVASSSRRARDIRAAAAKAPAIDAVRRRLVELGLLRSPARRARQSRQWLWFVPLLLLGTTRLGYGLSRGKPVLYLVGLLAVTVGALVVVARTSPGQRTRRGDAVVRELRQAWRKKEGRRGRSGRTPLPRGDAGRLLAVHGWDGLWVADRPLALAVGALATPASSSGGAWAAVEEDRRSWWSGGSGGGVWGGGGCGSSNGGGCSGGGGGGGCGGGGGGCGG